MKSGAVLGGVLLKGLPAGAACGGQPVQPLSKSRVVISRNPDLLESARRANPAQVLETLDRAMQALFDRDTALEAWQKVVKPGQVVGLKLNCLAGKGLSTRIELVDAVCERLNEAGIRPEDIVLWDRLNSDLESAGFRISNQGRKVRCIGNDVLGFEPNLMTHGSVGSLVCRTLTQVCDVVINLPVLKDHGIAGVTVALKNLFGAIHNPNKYHLNVGDPYVADVYMLPPIREKVRLTICDAIQAQYEGGPPYMPQWIWPYNGLLVAVDPVALDYVGWQIIERKRAETGMKSLRESGREPAYIVTAGDSSHRLGTADPKQIDLVEV